MVELCRLTRLVGLVGWMADDIAEIGSCAEEKGV